MLELIGTYTIIAYCQGLYVTKLVILGHFSAKLQLFKAISNAITRNKPQIAIATASLYIKNENARKTLKSANLLRNLTS